MPRNLLFAGAAAAGLGDARTPFVATLNDDALPELEWLEAVISSFENEDSVASVASKVLRFDDPQTIDSAGDVLGISGRAANRGWGRPDGPEFARPAEIFSASGCCAMYRREAYVSAGGLDASFVQYLEDVDLGFRLQLLGYSCRYSPTAVVRHVGGGTLRSRDYALWLTERNMIWNLVKNMPRELLLRNMVTIGRSQARPVPVDEGGTWAAWLTGKVSAVRESRGLLAKRKRIQAMRRVSIAALEEALTKGPLTHCHL